MSEHSETGPTREKTDKSVESTPHRTVTGFESGSDQDGDNILPHFSDTVIIRSIALTGIFLILLLYTIRVAAPVLIPITLAYILNLLLSPMVRKMHKHRVPTALGAAIVLIFFLVISIGSVYSLSGPAREWTQRVPELVQRIDYRLRPFSEPIKQARDAAEKVSSLTKSEKSESDSEVKVTVESESWLYSLLSATPQFLASLGIVVVLMYFLLAGGDSFLNKLVALTPKLADKKRAVSIMRDIQKDISHYLFTCTLINTVLGAAVATALYFLGMPNPILWGVMVGLLNFAPYIGPAVSLIIVTPVALLSFDTIGQALLVPLVVLGLNSLEGQIITPQIVGKRLALSPVVVFTSIVVWGWMWGIPGALMAIPIIAAIKVICQHIEPLNPIADVIGVVPHRI